jgi:hypothetical protein
MRDSGFGFGQTDPGESAGTLDESAALAGPQFLIHKMGAVLLGPDEMVTKGLTSAEGAQCINLYQGQAEETHPAEEPSSCPGSPRGVSGRRSGLTGRYPSHSWPCHKLAM